jgi:hypothetical protein
MPGFGWKFGPRWGYYYADKELDRSKVETDAKALLAKATKGETWKDPRGVQHIPLVFGNDVVGNLWEDADLKELEVGGYWAARFGVKVELVHDGKVVGMIWLNE